ncbi:hypothetical protein Hanom_Chr16g01512541 [Helianthus anomalus]
MRRLVKVTRVLQTFSFIIVEIPNLSLDVLYGSLTINYIYLWFPLSITNFEINNDHWIWLRLNLSHTNSQN